jgi:hypothetical protein
MKKISGVAARNEKVEDHMPDPRGRTMVYMPTVLVAERDRELRWLSRSEGDVFNGDHRFLIEPIQKHNKIQFKQSENLQGQWLNRLKVALHQVSQKR